MLANWLEALACPYCHSPLIEVAEAGLACSGCQATYPFRGQIPVLLRPQERAAAESFAHQYRELRLKSGWRPLERTQLQQLPEVQPDGYPPLYWRVRRQSYRAFVRWLDGRGSADRLDRVADLGAGSGWLSYRLSQAGYRSAAVDLSLDEVFGLQAGAAFAHAQPPFLRVQANLQHPPLASGRFRYVVYNASLHYADNLPAALHRASRALAPGGFVVIMDSPVGARSRTGVVAAERQLGRQEIQQALTAAGLQPHWLSVRRGLHWWLHQLRRRLVGEPVFHFPLIVARKR